MTTAACFRCGEWKFGSFTRCRSCGSVPTSEDDLIVSLVLAEDRMDSVYLEALRESIKSGRRLVPDEPPDSELRLAARRYRQMIGHHQGESNTFSPQDTSPKHRARKPGNIAGSGLFAIRILGFGIGLVPIVLLMLALFALVATGILPTEPTDRWPQFLLQFGPPPVVTALYALLEICRFENQRWTRLSARGSSQLAAALVETSGTIAWLFSWVWLVASFIDFGWQQAIGLLVVSKVAVLVWALFSRDSHALCYLATALLWPLIIALSVLLSWFGLVGT